MKTIRNFFLVFMAVLTALPLIKFNWDKNSISPIDNRKLTEFDLQDGDKTKMIEAFLKDRIGFRTIGIDTFTELNDMLFGEMVHPTYTYGQNGYVFFKLKAEQADTEFIDTYCRYIKKVQDYCDEREVPFIYCINPSKTTVYSRYLPKGYTYKNDFITELYKALKKYEIHYISNVELLTEKAQTEQVFNVKYDAGHWNDLGCFYGTNHLLDEISKDFPAVRQHTRDDFVISEKLETTLPVSHFRINEKVPYYENKREKKVENRAAQFSSIKLDNNYRSYGVHINKNKGSDKLPRVLFFHGSYYNSHVRFYDTSFQETYQIHNYQNFIDFDYYFNLFKPDCVILESAEYATTKGYFSIDKMREKQLNHPLSSVESLPHDVKTLDEFQYEISAQEAITLISVELDQPYAYGYLLADGEEYDLQISGTQAECSVQTGRIDLENTEKIYLYLFDR